MDRPPFFIERSGHSLDGIIDPEGELEGDEAAAAGANLRLLEAMRLAMHCDRVVVNSFDGEYFTVGGRNIVLSHQFGVVSQEKAVNVIRYTPTGERLKRGLSIEGHLSSSADASGERLSLEQVAEQSLLALHDGQLPNLKSGRTLLVLVAHNTTAEWSILADRDRDRLTKRLTAIRKSPVTDGRPIRLHNRRIGKVDVVLFDTMLLAPNGYKSLARLSSFLGDSEAQKKPLPEKYKRRMDLLLQHNPALFEEYALRDTEVTIKLFFLLQRQLNQLAFGGIRRPFRTLASAAVKGFLDQNEWFPGYLEGLKGERFAPAYPIISRAYHGGRNEGYFYGNTAEHPQTENRIWADIDFANCYPVAMAHCPRIDLDGEIELVSARYRWSEAAEKRLREENLPPRLIARAKAALEKGERAFEDLLREVRAVKRSRVNGAGRRRKALERRVRQQITRRNRARAKLLRDALLQPDNRHVDRWVAQFPEGETPPWIIPGFAKIWFEASDYTLFPYFAVKKDPYGLLYPLEGETIATAVEIVLAVQAGAKVEVLWSVELPMERDENGDPVLCFHEHLKELVKLRGDAKAKAEDYPEEAAREQLIKEFINIFYGKTAQGINHRRVFRPSTREFFSLMPSEMTEPCIAALTTGLPRAALSGALLAIEAFNRGREPGEAVVAISATTDGLLIGLPAPAGFSVLEYFKMTTPEDGGQSVPRRMKKGIDIRALFERFGCAGLLDLFDTYLPLRQMRQKRKALTGKDDFLELKHLADRVVSVKTRGQIGLVGPPGREYCSLLARFGHKVPLSLEYPDPDDYESLMKAGGIIKDTADAMWLLERFARATGEEEIERYPFLNLSSFRSIFEGKTKDLVNTISARKVNADWDWKRALDVDLEGETVSPFSRPHRNVASMLRLRRQAEAIRKGGLNATPVLVHQRLRVKGGTIRARGGTAVALTRMFLRGLVQGHFGAEVRLTEAQVAERLCRVWEAAGEAGGKKWARSDVNNARTGRWEVGALLHLPSQDRLLDGLCREFHADPDRVRGLLFATQVMERNTARLARSVAQALVNGPRLGIEPFVGLQQQGALPGRSALMEVLQPLAPGEPLLISEAFPVVHPPADRPGLQKLLVMVGLSGKEAKACAQRLAPAPEVPRPPRRNPREKQCLEAFVMALHQPDVQPAPVATGAILVGLKRFGLTKSGFYSVRRQRLASQPLPATAENRRQIEQMAAALELDAGKFLNALLEGV